MYKPKKGFILVRIDDKTLIEVPDNLTEEEIEIKKLEFINKRDKLNNNYKYEKKINNCLKGDAENLKE